MPPDPGAEGRRVLVVAPPDRDAEVLLASLGREGCEVHGFPDLDALDAALDERAGVVVLSEEAMDSPAHRLREALRAQPPWSDLPLILIAARPQGAPLSLDAFREGLQEFAGRAVVLERPLSLPSLASAVAAALRTRRRQFDLRDRLAELEAGRRAIEETAAEMRLVADTLPVLIAYIDRDLRYRYANRTYEEWFGRPLDAILGRPVLEVIGEAPFREREAAMRRALSGEAMAIEVRWPLPGDRDRDAEVRYLPRRGRDGEVDGFYAFVVDVTDRKRAEAELERRVAERTRDHEAEMARRAEAEAALRQSQKMEAIGQLTGGIAHDFNNMLTGVIGAMDVMKRRLAAGRTEDLPRFMDAASASAQRAAALTARLLAFSRRQSLDPRPVDVNRLLLSLKDLLRRTIQENIALSIQPGEAVGAALADANQLETAVLNLVINARDAMPEGGRLTIESRTVVIAAAAQLEADPGRYVVVSISDTGVGIAPEMVERVFDPFFTTKPIGQGTGLGLSMVYGFARQSGGQVRLRSEPGFGTTVSLYLPASEVAETRDDASSQAAPAEGAGQTVLLVEDDPSVRLLVREVLDELSYRTLVAEEAEGAIAVLASGEPIELMVSDVGLPGMNGRQLADVARRHRPGLPILFVTGYAGDATLRAGFLGDDMDMITKPFSIEEFAGKVKAMLA